MKALLLVGLLFQASPPSAEEAMRRSVSVVETAALVEASGAVEKVLGVKVVVYETKENLPPPMAAVFPSTSEPAEAYVTAGAVFLHKRRFEQLRSSFELAELLSHAAAHARLNHGEKWVEKLAITRLLGNTPHVPEQLPGDVLARIRAEFEAEAAPVAAEILATADCGPGPCALFGRLMAAARR